LVGCFLFADVTSVQRLLGFTLLIYMPVALYGIWQQLFGLTNFEIDYLKSGFTMDVGLLDDVRLRLFSTLNSPHALSVVMAMLSVVALAIPLHGRQRAWWQAPAGLILAGGCIATFVRAGYCVGFAGVLITGSRIRSNRWRLTGLFPGCPFSGGLEICCLEVAPVAAQRKGS
jgi:hypothetical protein